MYGGSNLYKHTHMQVIFDLPDDVANLEHIIRMAKARAILKLKDTNLA
jgi:hypothetical protein